MNRPRMDIRQLQKIRSANRDFSLPVEVKAPVNPGFQRNRKTFDIDIAEAFKRPANGLQQGIVLNRNIVLEEDFHRWQRQVGKVGDPGTSRAEHMVFRSFERHGYRCAESQPPGFDFEYLARVAGNAGGIEIDFYLRNRSVAIRVQGEYWHYKDDPTTESGNLERAILEGQGLTVVDILAQDTKTVERTDYVVELAWNGAELDIQGRIGVFR